MKRLVSLLLVLCMLTPLMAFAEQFGEDPIVEAGGDVFGETPEELVTVPDEEEYVLPETEDDLLLQPAEDIAGPEMYRELVLLQPTELSGTTLDVNTVRLTWSPVAFATYYKVYRKLVTETAYTELDIVPSNQLYYDVTDATPGVAAYYRVQAFNVSYNADSTPVTTESPQSPTLTYITLEAPELLDPRGLDADTVRLNWSTVAGGVTYEVEVSSSAGGDFVVARTGLTGGLCNVDGLVPGTGYYFRVRAVRAISNGTKCYSEYSNVGCGTPMERPTLTVSPSGSNAVLNWSECSGATGYVIYRKVGVSGSYQKLTIVDAVTTYTDEGLTPGEVYYYYVYGILPVGSYNCFSLSSDKRYFSIVEGAVINAVENTGTLEQTINWTGPDGNPTCAGANGYQVFAATSADGLYSQIGETTGTTFVATGLQSGVTYYYKVRSMRTFSNGDVCYGPWSNVMSLSEAGTLQLSGLSAVNLTYKNFCTANGLAFTDVTGGYVGDVFSWSVKASGGSGAYAFKWSLVSLDGAGSVTLQDYSEGFTALPEGEDTLVAGFSMVLEADHITMINSQRFALQVEVKDSLGEVYAITASPETLAEMNFCAAQPVYKMQNVTLRVGDTLTLEHGVFEQCGDTLLLDVSNPTGAVSLSGNVVTAVSNGYATVLVTPERYKNDVLIIYNITVGYATLGISSITPSATTMNAYDTLSWDIAFSGGRPPFTVGMKVYRDTTLVVDTSATVNNEGTTSVNYTPTEPGVYALEVTIYSEDSQSATLRSPVTTVVAYNPVTIEPSATSAAAGTSVTWVTAYSGSGTVVRRDYTVYRDGIVVATSVGTNELSYTYTPTVAGSYVVKAVVYESNGNRIEVTSVTVTVTADGNFVGAVGTVNGTRVAQRRGPGTSNSVIQRIDRGETVNVIKEQDGWYYIEYKGTYGWMMSRYVKLN